MKKSVSFIGSLALLFSFICSASSGFSKEKLWGQGSSRWGMEIELTEWSLPYLMPWFDFNDFQVRSLMKAEKDPSTFPTIPKDLFDQYFTYNPEVLFQMLESDSPSKKNLAIKLTEGISLERLQKELVLRQKQPTLLLSDENRNTNLDLLTQQKTTQIFLPKTRNESPTIHLQMGSNSPVQELVDTQGIPFSQEKKIEIPSHIETQEAWNLINQRLMEMNQKELAILLSWDQLSAQQKARLAVVNDTRLLLIKLNIPEAVKSYFDRWSWNTEFGYMEFRHLEDFRGVDFKTFFKDVVQLCQWAHVERQLLYGDKSSHLPPASLHYHTSAPELDAILPYWLIYLYLNHAETSLKNPESVSSLWQQGSLGKSTQHRVTQIAKNRIENRMQIGNFLIQAQTLNKALSSMTLQRATHFLDQQIQESIRPEVIDHIAQEDPISLLELAKWTLNMDSSALREARNDIYQVTSLNEQKRWSPQDQEWVLSVAQNHKKQLLYKILQLRRKLHLSDSFLMQLSSPILQMKDEQLLAQFRYFIESELQNADENIVNQRRSLLLSQIRLLPEFQNLSFGQKVLFSTVDQRDYPSVEQLTTELFKTSSFDEMQEILEALIHHPESNLTQIQKVLDKMLRSANGNHFFLALHVFTYPRIPKEKLLNVQNLKDFSHWRFFTFAEILHVDTSTPWHPSRIADTMDSLYSNATDLLSHPNLWNAGLQRLSRETLNYISPAYLDQRCLTYTSCEKLQKTLIENIYPTRAKSLSTWTEDFGFPLPQYFSFHTSQRLTNDVVLELLRKRPIPESFWKELVDYLSNEFVNMKKVLKDDPVPSDVLEELHYILEKLTSRKTQLRLDETTLQKLDPFLHLEPIAKLKKRFNQSLRCDKLF